ncbi:MAG: hypothetical protein AB7P76_07680 [Candidatus Melainabacteria bacterium]
MTRDLNAMIRLGLMLESTTRQAVMATGLLVGLLTAGIVMLPLTWAEDFSGADDGVTDETLPVEDATAETPSAPRSRLNRLLIRSANLYLPTRLVLGQENKFVARANPGQQVLVFLSPEPSGLVLASEQSARIPLRVGPEYEQVVGVANEKGVAELSITLPDEQDWAGHILYVDAIAYDRAEIVPPRMDGEGHPVADVNPLVDLRTVANAQQLDLMNPMGQRTSVNALQMAMPAEANGAMVMPSMPGFSPQLLQQITNLSEVGAGNEHKKNLLDDGERDENNALDRNSLITRPGSLQPGLK